MPKKSPTHILCHYSEIGLKGKNRNYFEKKLSDNIKYLLKINVPGSIENIRRLRGRFLITLTDIGKNSLSSIQNTLENVFGLAYFAFVYESQNDINIIKNDALKILQDHDFNTFRVTARCVNSKFGYSSQALNEIIGEAIIDKYKKTVSLTYPELTCFIDILDENAFIFTKKIQGLRGLPVGVSGKAVAMLSGGIDSPVAAYYALKRGLDIVYVHFHSAPLIGAASLDKVRELVAVLNKYRTNSKLYLVPFANIQQQIFINCEEKFRILLYRRYMLKIAEKITEIEYAKAIITGESLGQVASQTIENIAVVENAVELPVLRPLIGFDKQEIISKAREIGTYSISILPHQDCCTLYMPKHPATKARLSDIDNEEQNLEEKNLIQDTLKKLQYEIF